MKKDPSDENGNVADLAKSAQAAFSLLRRKELSPSPFLKTRVLAHLEEKMAKNSRWRLWPVLSTSSGLFTVILIIWFYLISSATLQGVEGEELLVRYQYKSMSPQVESVDVVIPEGVKFQSHRHPHIRHLRTLKVSGERVRRLGYLPVVIKSIESGKKWIQFIFRDHDGRVVKEKKVPIHFHHKSVKATLDHQKVPT
jgi:hypothetical protein